jgi:hypothetical protein
MYRQGGKTPKEIEKFISRVLFRARPSSLLATNEGQHFELPGRQGLEWRRWGARHTRALTLRTRDGGRAPSYVRPVPRPSTSTPKVEYGLESRRSNIVTSLPRCNWTPPPLPSLIRKPPTPSREGGLWEDTSLPSADEVTGYVGVLVAQTHARSLAMWLSEVGLNF